MILSRADAIRMFSYSKLDEWRGDLEPKMPQRTNTYRRAKKAIGEGRKENSRTYRGPNKQFRSEVLVESKISVAAESQEQMGIKIIQLKQIFQPEPDGSRPPFETVERRPNAFTEEVAMTANTVVRQTLQAVEMEYERPWFICLSL